MPGEVEVPEEAVVVSTTEGPAVAPTWMVDALRAAGREEPFEIGGDEDE